MRALALPLRRRPAAFGKSVFLCERALATEGLQDGLRDLGYVEGKTHLFVYRFAQGDAERFPPLASELVSLPVDVIVSWGTPASLAALSQALR